MQYPYQIKSLEQYHEAYQKSVEDPEGFWAEIAENFQWRKKWDQRCLNGILKNQKLNGSKVAN